MTYDYEMEKLTNLLKELDAELLTCEKKSRIKRIKQRIGKTNRSIKEREKAVLNRKPFLDEPLTDDEAYEEYCDMANDGAFEIYY